MDSVVDTFFPLIDFVEEEADAIDSEIIMHDALSESPLRKLAAEAEAEASALREQEAEERLRDSTSSGWKERKEKEKAGLPDGFELDDLKRQSILKRGSGSFDMPLGDVFPSSTSRTNTLITRRPTLTWASSSFLPPLPTRIVPRRFALVLYTLLARFLLLLSLHPAQRQAKKLASHYGKYRLESNPNLDRGEMLKRMVNMRRLTTGLTRLLGPKREVVERLRKRVEELGREGWGGGAGREMGTYFGDIQGKRWFFLLGIWQAGLVVDGLAMGWVDHIIELQGTLLHYEYLLSQAQPAYLAQLRVRLSIARSGTDKAILRVTYIAVGILPVQFLLCLSFHSFFHLLICLNG